MAKLTHIEDVERRNAEAEEEREMLEAQQALEQARELKEEAQEEQAAERQTPGEQAVNPQQTTAASQPAQAQPLAEAPETEEPRSDAGQSPDSAAPAPHGEAGKEAQERSADEEAEFHGLDSNDSMGGMQKVLIVLAAVVFVAAILYIVNTWVHFV